MLPLSTEPGNGLRDPTDSECSLREAKRRKLEHVCKTPRHNLNQTRSAVIGEEERYTQDRLEASSWSSPQPESTDSVLRKRMFEPSPLLKPDHKHLAEWLRLQSRDGSSVDLRNIIGFGRNSPPLPFDGTESTSPDAERKDFRDSESSTAGDSDLDISPSSRHDALPREPPPPESSPPSTLIEARGNEREQQEGRSSKTDATRASISSNSDYSRLKTLRGRKWSPNFVPSRRSKAVRESDITVTPRADNISNPASKTNVLQRRESPDPQASRHEGSGQPSHNVAKEVLTLKGPSSPMTLDEPYPFRQAPDRRANRNTVPGKILSAHQRRKPGARAYSSKNTPRTVKDSDGVGIAFKGLVEKFSPAVVDALLPSRVPSAMSDPFEKVHIRLLNRFRSLTDIHTSDTRGIDACDGTFRSTVEYTLSEDRTGDPREQKQRSLAPLAKQHDGTLRLHVDAADNSGDDDSGLDAPVSPNPYGIDSTYGW